MNYRFEQLNIRNNEHFRAVNQIEEWSSSWKTMNTYGFTQLVRHPLGLLAFAEETKGLHSGTNFAGHVAITEISKINQKNFAKIGALAVGEEYRGNGLASAMIGELIKTGSATFPEIERYYAFVHPDSLDSFADNGAEIVGERYSVPPVTGCNIIVSINPEG